MFSKQLASNWNDGSRAKITNNRSFVSVAMDSTQRSSHVEKLKILLSLTLALRLVVSNITEN